MQACKFSVEPVGNAQSVPHAMLRMTFSGSWAARWTQRHCAPGSSMRHDTHPELRTRDRERLMGGMMPARGIGTIGSCGPARGSDTVDAHGRFRVPALAGSTAAHPRNLT